MENRYYQLGGLFVAIGEDVEIMCQPSTNDFQVTSEGLDVEWHEDNGYTEITRTEFMEAYLPIAEKMNNKIANL